MLSVEWSGSGARVEQETSEEEAATVVQVTADGISKGGEELGVDSGSILKVEVTGFLSD